MNLFHQHFSRVAAARLILSSWVVAIWSTGAQAGDTLFDNMPDNACALIQVETPQRVLPPKLMEAVNRAMGATSDEGEKLLSAIKRIPGGFVVGIVPNKKGAFNEPPEVDVAIDLSRPDAKLDEWIEKYVIPALTLIDDRTLGGLKAEKHEGTLRMVTGAGDTVFAWAWKDKVAFGSNRPEHVLAWRRGDFPEKRWVGAPGVRRLLRGLPKKSVARVLMAPSVLLEALPKPAANSIESVLLKALAPEDVEAIALDLDWERYAFRLTLTAALADECKGIFGALKHGATESTTLGVFPDDFMIVGRVGWSNLQALVDGVYSITDQFDETIGQEYREDLETFKTDSGINWDGDLLKNLVGEMAFGVRVDFTRRVPIGWAVVHRIGDRATFQRQLDQLLVKYELPVRTQEKLGVRIHSGGERVPAAFAVVGDLFVVADSAETVTDIARKGGGSAKGSPANTLIRKMRSDLGEANLAGVYLDVETMTRKAPVIALVVGPQMAPVLLRGCVGLSSACRERLSTTVLVWDFGRAAGREAAAETAQGSSDEAVTMIVEMAATSLVQARQQSKRIVSMSNMRAVGMVFMMYAETHQGQFPESLEAMMKAMPDAVTIENFRSPYDGKGPESFDELSAKAYVVYRPGLTSKSPPDEIVLAERTLVPGGEGASFLFVDGHVEFIPEPRAGELIGLIQSGAESVKGE